MTKKILLLTTLIASTVFGANILLANSGSDTKVSIKSNSNVVNPMHSRPEMEQEAIEYKALLKKIEDPESTRIKCDEDKLADYCILYASYQVVILEDIKIAYDYYIKGYNLGYKERGDEIANIQINHPEIFTEETQPSIDKSIEYLEASVNTGSIDAIRLLGGVYSLPEYNRFHYEKAEHYLKLGIENNIRTSRVMLANLYLQSMKDYSKTAESIQLYKESLLLERDLVSAMSLANIYLYPVNFDSAIEQDYVKGLAYCYITRDLRKENPHQEIPKVEEKVINMMEIGFPPEVIVQAKALYKKIKKEMDETQNKRNN